MVTYVPFPGAPLADVAAADDAAAAVPTALVTDPTRVTAACREVSGDGFVVSWAGYPTGRHHSLVKAAEARLAVQMGAAEVWVCVDESLADVNSYLADLITVREACPAPVRLALFLSPTLTRAEAAAAAAVSAAEKAGFDYLATDAELGGAESASRWDSSLPLVRLA